MKTKLEVTYQDKNGKLSGFNSVEMTCSAFMAMQFAKGYKAESNLIVFEIVVFDENGDIFGVVR